MEQLSLEQGSLKPNPEVTTQPIWSSTTFSLLYKLLGRLLELARYSFIDDCMILEKVRSA